MQIKSRNYVGYLDTFNEQVVRGWVRPRKDSQIEQAYICLKTTGDNYSSCWEVNLSRPDVSLALGGRENCGFCIQLPPSKLSGDFILSVGTSEKGPFEQVFRGEVDIFLSSKVRKAFLDDQIPPAYRGWVEGGLDEGNIYLKQGNCVIPLANFQISERPDVVAAYSAIKAVGFSFNCIELDNGSFSLVQEGQEQIEEIATLTSDSSFKPRFIEQLGVIKALASKKGSVCIINWEASHNPIGRAYALHNIVKQKHPVAVISYKFQEFGDDLWGPIRGEDFVSLEIPWEDRTTYINALADLNLKFEIAWLCKPRAPTFDLARNICNEQTKIILDYDDNERHFSMASNRGAERIYGLVGAGMAERVASKIIARTAASISLAEKNGAEIVRHVRKPGPEIAVNSVNFPAKPTAATKVLKKLLFLGTVRPHKRIGDLSRIIQGLERYNLKFDFELHVYGDVQPQSLEKELRENGAIVGPMVQFKDLHNVIGKFDILITGYPAGNKSSEDDPIKAFQISAKISDGLASGVPVLTEETPATRDLENLPGVFLFQEHNFTEKLLGAVEFSGKDRIEMPGEFTIDGGYRGFSRALAVAQEAREVLNYPLFSTRPLISDKLGGRRLVLLWKQLDAGIYGRRIDQIARAYKRANKDCKVLVIELAHDSESQDLRRLSERSDCSDASLKAMYLHDKNSRGYVDEDGVEYLAVTYRANELAATNLESFFLEQAILPDNSLLVVFPIVKNFFHVASVLRPYKKIIDFVDNHLSWSKTAAEVRMVKEQALYFMSRSEAVVTNSEENANFLANLGKAFSVGVNVTVIKNWYRPRLSDKAVTDSPVRDQKTLKLVYTGNLNDRLDWDVLHDLADFGASYVELHIAGSLRALVPAAKRLFSLPNVVYHGPLNEHSSVELIRCMDRAVIPHVVNHVSTYMDPIKIEMYKSIGIEIVAFSLPGVTASPRLVVCDNKLDFITRSLQRETIQHEGGQPDRDGEGDRYVKLIDTAFAAFSDASRP